MCMLFFCEGSGDEANVEPPLGCGSAFLTPLFYIGEQHNILSGMHTTACAIH